MAPEFPADLIVINLYFESDELRLRIEVFERSSGMRARGERLRVSWNAEKHSDAFSPVGDGAVHLHNVAELLRVPYTAIADLVDGSYNWRYATPEPVMIVLVLPSGYVLTDCVPQPRRGKVAQGDRLAVYWLFQGDDKNDAAEITWRMEKSPSAVTATAARITKAAVRRPPTDMKESPIAIEQANNAGRIDKYAAWTFGSVTIAFLMLLIFLGPPSLSPDYKPIIKFIAAIAGGTLSGHFVGALHLSGKLPGKIPDLQIAAAGGFAVFIFVMVYW